jgi:hypothetical protein
MRAPNTAVLAVLGTALCSAAAAAAAAAAAQPYGGGACARRATSGAPSPDCMLSGRCDNYTCNFAATPPKCKDNPGGGAACVCFPGWTGAHCGALDLEPALLRSGFRSPNASSWGGTIVRDGGGDGSGGSRGSGGSGGSGGSFHLVASRFVGRCGLTSWKSNSEVVKATSSSPLGPFASARADGADDVVRFTFAHNPAVFAAPPDAATGEPAGLVLFQIGCGGGNGTHPPRADCVNGSTPGVVPQPPTAATTPPVAAAPAGAAPAAGGGAGANDCNTPHWSGVAGPAPSTAAWPAPTSLLISQRPGVNASAVWHSGGAAPFAFTNPSLTVAPPPAGGGVLLAYSIGMAPGYAPLPSPGGNNTRKHIGVAAAASWRGPFFDLTPYAPVFRAPAFASSEDPHIFLDPAGSLHLLAHTSYANPGAAGWRHVAAHAFSRDGAAWEVASVPPYTRDILWETGATTTVFARERPQIYLDAAGWPAALVNGVEPGNVTMPFDEGPRTGFSGDWSYTHVQGVQQRT